MVATNRVDTTASADHNRKGGSSEPLRVLQINSLFSGGGADNQTLELAAGLREVGDPVILSVPLGSRWESRARRLNLTVDTFAPKGWLKPAMISQWARLIHNHDLQIIHAHQGRDYWPAILAARLARRGTRVVITRHLMTRPRRLTRLLLLSFADVIAVSRAVEEVLQRELRGPPERLHRIYGGIHPKAFQPERTPVGREFRRQQGWRDDDLVFGVVGACDLPRGKGQLEFLEAASRLKSEFPQARFVMIGRGSMEPLLRERIGTLGLSGTAVMLPFTDDIPSVMNALDVLVHPALGTEALGLVLWEAMACAKPVIASRLHGIPEAFVENEHGLLVPPSDLPALAEAMRRLAASQDLRTRFGRAGQKHIEHNFSRAILAKNTHELYTAILQRP